MKKTLTWLLWLYSIAISAQNLPVSIKFLDEKQKPVIGTSVKLTLVSDSSKISFTTADTLGIAKFNISAGQYRMVASSIGFKNVIKGIVISEKQTSFTFSMQTDVNTLSGVQVIAKKPLVVQEDDKTIIDPEPIANASTSGMDVLEKSPGVFIDQEGNVYLNGSTPATIYINGREQRMGTAEIANILRNLPPNSIDKIEILRTPSAKYDASGSGGVVNIILKKGFKIGRTGSVYTTVNQGKFGSQSIGVSLNNNEGSTTTYVSLNVNNRNYYDKLLTDRTLASDTIISQEAYTTTPAQVFFGNYGLGYELNKKWNLNFDGRLSYGNGQTETTNDNSVLPPIYSSSSLISKTTNHVLNDSKTLSLNQGFNTKYKIDSLGSELTSDFSYGLLSSKTAQAFETIFVQPKKTDVFGDGDIQTSRHLFSGQIDLKYKFTNKFTFESGLKSTILRFDNATDFMLQVGDIRRQDAFRTNSFDYRENINAAYLQGSQSFGKFVLKVGTRLENTNMEGHQRIPKDTTFSIRRTDFFPFVYFSRVLGKIAGWDMQAFLIYRRSITRPVYEYLNPFPRFIDQYLYEAGNPQLKPQFTQNVEANITISGRPIFALGKNYTQDIFTNVVYQDPRNSSVAVRTYDNLGKNEETYFRLLGAIPPGKKYFFVAGTTYNLNKYNGIYEDKPLTFSRGSISVFTYHQLQIDKRSMATLHAFYRYKGQQQFYELGTFGNVSLSINRYFMNRKLLVTASMNDVFYTNRNTFTLNQGNIQAEGSRRGDTRRFGLNIRYNFGFKRKEERTNMFNIDME